MSHLDQPLQAVNETALTHGITPDRCEILQDGHTLVVRITASVVARVITDPTGPRQGTTWFARETALAQHLTENGAPVIPLHEALPPGPHERLGYTLNFWQYVNIISTPVHPAQIGSTLQQCHTILKSFTETLPTLGILTESIQLLENSAKNPPFPAATMRLLHEHLTHSRDILADYPHQPLHGDAHLGNLLNTTNRVLWADWEDAFSGPVEWDLASIIWNARILEGNHAYVDEILHAYQKSGGHFDPTALNQSLVGRAAVMSVWYPILYPNAGPERLAKLKHRLQWLEQQKAP